MPEKDNSPPGTRNFRVSVLIDVDSRLSETLDTYCSSFGRFLQDLYGKVDGMEIEDYKDTTSDYSFKLKFFKDNVLFSITLVKLRVVGNKIRVVKDCILIEEGIWRKEAIKELVENDEDSLIKLENNYSKRFIKFFEEAKKKKTKKKKVKKKIIKKSKRKK